MDKGLVLNDVLFENSAQKEDLSFWLDFVGIQKYYEILCFCKKHYNIKKVEYALLKSVAIYDSKLSDALYSILRLFENRIKAIVANEYGEIAIDKKNYLYVINECCSKNLSTVKIIELNYNYRMEKNSSIYNLLKESSIKGALAILTVLNKDLLTTIPDYIIDNANMVNDLRNIVFHHKMIVEQVPNYKELISCILKTLPSRIRQKHVVKINECSIDKETNLPSIACDIAFIIDEILCKSILDFGGIE